MSTDQFNSWCLVELFGHNRIVGKVSEATIGGCSFVRVDVPEIGERPAYTRYFPWKKNRASPHHPII